MHIHSNNQLEWELFSQNLIINMSKNWLEKTFRSKRNYESQPAICAMAFECRHGTICNRQTGHGNIPNSFHSEWKCFNWLFRGTNTSSLRSIHSAFIGYMGASAKDMTTEIPKRHIDRIRKAAAFIVENCRFYRSKNGKNKLSSRMPSVQWLDCPFAIHPSTPTSGLCNEHHWIAVEPTKIQLQFPEWQSFFSLSNNSKGKKQLTEINYLRRFYIDFPKMNRALVVKYSRIFTFQKKST